VIRRFNRYELKYVLDARKCDQIIEDLGTFATPDDHGGKDGYRVVSLYYDSPGLDFFWAKIDGIKFRRKLRLRIYPERDIERTERGMVEIKQRINRTVQKRRLELPLALAEQLCAGSVDMRSLDELDQEVASEVQYLINAMHLQPTCITAYRRRAFVGNRYDSGLRITFDSDLRGRVHALRVNQAADIIGVRALLIHAESEAARAFYEHLAEFDPSPTDPLHLVLLLKDLRRALA